MSTPQILTGIVPGGNGSNDTKPPTPQTVAADLRRAWRAAYPQHEMYLPWMPKALRGLAGWPWPPTDPRGAALATVLADVFVHAIGDLDKADDAARYLAQDAAPTEFGTEAVRLTAEWRQVLWPKFRATAAKCYRDRLMWEAEEDQTCIVKGLLIAGQPMAIGGPEKSMKTSLSIDLAAALCTATSFLGTTVPEAVNVAAITLETRPGTWMDTFIKAAEARGCDGGDALKRLTITSTRDMLAKKVERAELGQFLRIAEVKAVIIDPLYLCLPRVQTTDITAMGRALRRLTSHITEAGASPIIVHHSTKATAIGALPSLHDLTGAGVGAFCRSWLLLNRESEYSGGNVHALLALAGSSAGTCSPLRIRFDEKLWMIEAKPIGEEAATPMTAVAAAPPSFFARKG